eukprot:m.747623 g.747623  ORF g.747623 m.747623 type:complete len:158 (+) comp58964_c0_seq2:1185-1658(+)
MMRSMCASTAPSFAVIMIMIMLEWYVRHTILAFSVTVLLSCASFRSTNMFVPYNVPIVGKLSWGIPAEARRKRGTPPPAVSPARYAVAISVCLSSLSLSVDVCPSVFSQVSSVSVVTRPTHTSHQQLLEKRKNEGKKRPCQAQIGALSNSAVFSARL